MAQAQKDRKIQLKITSRLILTVPESNICVLSTFLKLIEEFQNNVYCNFILEFYSCKSKEDFLGTQPKPPAMHC